MCKAKQSVLFVTTRFGPISNGPGVYSKNLWQFFADDKEIDFHLVAAESSIKHPKIYTLQKQPKGFGSAVYQAVNDLAVEVLSRLGPNTILHANIAHTITPSLARDAISIVQVNDTEVCQWRPSLRKLRRHGIRRNAALCWRRQRESAVLKQATRTICNSRHTATTICQQYTIEPDCVKTIYKAIDLSPFQDASKEQNTAPTPKHRTIVFVGSNWRRKGLDILLRAVAQLSLTDRTIRLRIFGEPDRFMHKEFTSLARKLNLDNYVCFAGPITRDQLPAELAAATMLVLPSREEALGLAAIEALATGIPVVASNVGGIPEIMTAECCGRLVDPGDVVALSDAIEKVLRYPADDLVRTQRQQAVARFGIKRLEQELRDLYREVANGAK